VSITVDYRAPVRYPAHGAFGEEPAATLGLLVREHGLLSVFYVLRRLLAERRRILRENGDVERARAARDACHACRQAYETLETIDVMEDQ